MAIFGAARQLCRQNRLKTHTHTQRQSHTLSLTHTYAASSVHLPNAKTLACLSAFEPDSSLKMPPPSTTRPQEANKIDRKKQTENIRYIYRYSWSADKHQSFENPGGAIQKQFPIGAQRHRSSLSCCLLQVANSIAPKCMLRKSEHRRRVTHTQRLIGPTLQHPKNVQAKYIYIYAIYMCVCAF